MRHVEIIPWEALQDIADDIYEKNAYLSPYQSYHFLSIAGIGKVDKNPFACIGYKPCNFVLFRDKKAMAIAPLYYKRVKSGTTKLLLRGHFTSAGHLDFIYREDFTKEDYDFLIKEIGKHFENCTLEMDRVSERSLTYKYAAASGAVRMVPSKMVSIPLPDTYDQWYHSLSKSVRQNIRTSYNRMNTDGKTFSFKLYYGQCPEKRVNQDILRLFARRLCQHSKIKSRLLEKYLYFTKSRHPMTKGIDTDKNYIGAVLYIDGILAAFFSGFVGNDDRILVPRLAINLDFNRFSPGGILINESIKAIKSETFERNITELDLQRGDEPYKYSYGGVEYYDYSFSLGSGFSQAKKSGEGE